MNLIKFIFLTLILSSCTIKQKSKLFRLIVIWAMCLIAPACGILQGNSYGNISVKLNEVEFANDELRSIFTNYVSDAMKTYSDQYINTYSHLHLVDWNEKGIDRKVIFVESPSIERYGSKISSKCGIFKIDGYPFIVDPDAMSFFRNTGSKETFKYVRKKPDFFMGPYDPPLIQIEILPNQPMKASGPVY